MFSRAALHFLSTITLRSTENSQLLFEVGAAETIVESMRLHPESKLVQVMMCIRFFPLKTSPILLFIL